jgi:SagB-type dehydrogenase family enzyme
VTPDPTREDVLANLSKHSYIREIAQFSMLHSLASTYTESTVVGTPDVVVRGRWGNLEGGFLGEHLLLNYRPDGANMGFGLGVARFFQHDAVMSSVHADLEEDLEGAIKLPHPKQLRAGLSAVVGSRRSKRAFAGEAVSLQDLSTLLQHACGVSGTLPVPSLADESNASIKVRCAPSGGGLYPVSLYLIAFNVEDLPGVLYEYLPVAHSLRNVPTERSRDDLALTCYTSEFDIKDTSFVAVYVYDLYKNSRKYGNSGVVFGLIEVGAMSQNLHLARTAMGMAGCCLGGYNKQKIEQALQIDGVSRHVVHVTAIGQEAS